LPSSRSCAGGRWAQSQQVQSDGEFSTAAKITTLFCESSSVPLLMTALQPALASPLFNGINAAAFFVRFAKLQRSISPREQSHVLLKTLVNRTEQMLLHHRRMGKQAVANLFWSVASLRNTLPELQTLIPALLRAINEQANKMEPQQVANVIWGCATLRLPPDQIKDILDPLAEGAFLNADDFDAQALANIVWSCGKLHEDVPGFIDLVPLLLNANAAQSLNQFTSQELANLCWGLALCNFQEPSFMTRVASVMASRSPSLTDRSADLDLPQIAWSFAKLGMLDTPLMKAISKRMVPVLQRMNSWGLCALLWSYDKLDTSGQFLNFHGRLQAEAVRRSLSSSDIERSQNGPDRWRK